MGEVAVSGGEGREAVKLEKNVEDEDGGGGGSGGSGSGEVVSWESNLPKLVLRVLLVEADDSTRQIIAALLRKCGYKVVAVGDGLKAWEVIKRKHHKMDLILTETELPSISGFALLTLVMEHDMCKNIPVIMMSSEDSTSRVLKCMLKGAADYLIKPVRRNELRNLWQHVWRRQTRSGAPVPQNVNVTQKKVEATCENNLASKHSNGYAASMQENKECSEKGSEAQSSCTTPYMEAESGYMQNMQDIPQLRYESASNLSNTDMERLKECARPDNESVVLESEAKEKSGTFGSYAVPLKEGYTSTGLRLREDNVSATKMVRGEGMQPESYKGDANITSETHISRYGLDEPSSGAIDFIGAFGNWPKCTAGPPDNRDDGTKHMGSTPQLELSLRSSLDGSNKQVNDERPVLNHSDASAFSWYNNSKTLQSFFPTFPITESEVANKSHDSQENMSTLVSGQTEEADLCFPRSQLGMVPIAGAKSDNICTAYGHSFPSLFHRQSDVTPTWSSKSACNGEQSSYPVNSPYHSNPEVYLSEEGCHLSDKTTYKSIGQTVQGQNNQEQMEELRPGSPATGQSGCSSLGNAVGNAVGRSGHGSNCSSTNGNATLAVSGEMEASESLNDSGRSVHEGFGGADPLRSSQREAALTKFRLKRKDRCFEKKVRYQSRKILAEQHPRVKGQFVHRARTNAPTANAVGL
ncbi:two-component response regulator-like APRR5 isoform X1 [Pyrus communis]|uniref:two-component response regulator-like APRR5 isoform X1 n=1 Tax=Pyrus communis TaxID=23211 RepID=UPI0035C1B760